MNANITEEEYLNILCVKNIEDSLNNQKSKKIISYYLNTYHQLQSGKKIIWNWGAFFFGSNWLAYKRLYLVSAFSLVFISLTPILIGFIIFFLHSYNTPILPQHIFNISLVLVGMSTLFSGIFLGAFGNYIHYIWISKWKLKNPCKKFPVGPDMNIVIIFIFSHYFCRLFKGTNDVTFTLTTTCLVLLGFHWYYYKKD